MSKPIWFLAVLACAAGITLGMAPGRYKYNLHVVAPGFAAARGAVDTLEDNYAAIVLRRLGDSEQSSIRVSVDAWPEGTRVAACDVTKDSVK